MMQILENVYQGPSVLSPFLFLALVLSLSSLYQWGSFIVVLLFYPKDGDTTLPRNATEHSVDYKVQNENCGVEST